ncbi:MAG: HlyD family type I secretion periplasmic adaptor subunit [Pseudomonadota bacterium]
MTGGAFSSRPVIALGLLMLALLIGGVGAWSARAQIAGAIIAPGEIEHDQKSRVIEHADGGRIAEIFVKEGDEVLAGQPLLRLDGGQIEAELALLETQIREMSARRVRLEAQRDGREDMAHESAETAPGRTEPEFIALLASQRRLFEASAAAEAQAAEQSRARRAQLRAQIDGFKSQRTSIEHELVLITQELGAQQSLRDRGLAPAGAILALERQRAALRRQSGQLLTLRHEAQAQQDELAIIEEKRIAERRAEVLAQLSDLHLNEAELRSRRAMLKARHERLLIRTPLAGLVHDLGASVETGVLGANEPALMIVPAGRPYTIAARISVSDIDHVEVGQPATLRLSALDHGQTPELSAHVAALSARALRDDATGKSYFRAFIKPLPGEIETLQKRTQLAAGMPVEALIRTRARTPLSYLLKPMRDYFARALREPG